MGKAIFLDTLMMVLVSTNSPGVLDHGMKLNVSDRNLGYPSIVFTWERGEEIGTTTGGSSNKL